MSFQNKGFPRTFTITTQPYLDNCAYNNQCYKNILMTNVIPDGPLNKFVRRINLKPLSPFQKLELAIRLEQYL